MLIFKYSQLTKKLDYKTALTYKIKRDYHLGQFKLFFTELYFLSKVAKPGNLVLYVGAATGHHISLLADLFPDLMFDLWDPGRFDVLPRPNIKIYNTFFTVDDAKKYAAEGSNTLFMCDIRTIEIAKFKKNKDIAGMDQLVEDDMYMQANWAKIIKPLWAYLKLRFPYDIVKTKYLTGTIYLQPYAPRSTEMRLMTQDYTTYIEYDNHEVDEKLAYFNYEIRPKIISDKWAKIMSRNNLHNSWDNNMGLAITHYYLHMIKHVHSKSETEKLFMQIVQFHVKKFGDKYDVLFDKI